MLRSMVFKQFHSIKVTLRNSAMSENGGMKFMQETVGTEPKCTAGVQYLVDGEEKKKKRSLHCMSKTL